MLVLSECHSRERKYSVVGECVETYSCLADVCHSVDNIYTILPHRTTDHHLCESGHIMPARDDLLLLFVLAHHRSQQTEYPQVSAAAL